MRSYHLEGSELTERNEARPALGPQDILIRVRAASLNKRDLLILNGTYPLPAKPGVIPLSDGAGEVIAVGERVRRFRVGDRVMGSYFARWKSGPIAPDLLDQLGCALDGMLTEEALLHEEWAVGVPDHLSWEEASTLPCAAVTAWNSLVGPAPLTAGQTVLTLGTGGVSLFALQIAKLHGAKVIVTTSSDEKADKLRALGADVVIDYVKNPEWGVLVREATAGRGVDVVVETMGPDTIGQSMRAVGLHGQVMVLTARGRKEPEIRIPAAAYSTSMATLRRVFVGNRASFEAMNAALAVAKTRPVIERVFPFAEAREAYRYYQRGTAFGKVVITI